MAMWVRKVAAGASIDLPVQEPFVGGLAVKADSGEWRLYEEQEQLMKALTFGGSEAAIEEEIRQAASLAEEADQRLEQAQLEQAIALSLQAEEERLRQIETQTAPAIEVPVPAAPVFAVPYTDVAQPL